MNKQCSCIIYDVVTNSCRVYPTEKYYEFSYINVECKMMSSKVEARHTLNVGPPGCNICGPGWHLASGVVVVLHAQQLMAHTLLISQFLHLSHSNKYQLHIFTSVNGSGQITRPINRLTRSDMKYWNHLVLRREGHGLASFRQTSNSWSSHWLHIITRPLSQNWSTFQLSIWMWQVDQL